MPGPRVLFPDLQRVLGLVSLDSCDAGFNLVALKQLHVPAQGHLFGLVPQCVLGRFDLGPQLDRVGAVDRARDP